MWNNLTYTKKGAIIGFVFSIIIFIGKFFLLFLSQKGFDENIIYIILSIIIGWPSLAIMMPLSFTFFFIPTYIALIINSILFFIIYSLLGALIGKIIEKIKYKKEVENV